MFIDYVPLMLVNMAAGLLILAWYVAWAPEGDEQKRWVPGFAMVGLIATVCGFHMIWVWPLPGSYNVAFGEMTLLLGILFLGAALALACGYGLRTVGIYAAVAGFMAVVVGVRMYQLNMTNAPLLSSIGFVLTGGAGVLMLPTICWRRNPVLRAACTLCLVGAAAIWIFTATLGYWGHLSRSKTWTPRIMEQAPRK